MKRFLVLASTLILVGRTFAVSSENIRESRTANGLYAPLPVKFTSKNEFNSAIRGLVALESTASRGVYIPDEKNVHIRALKDFKTRYNDVSKVMWFSDDNGFTSYFTKDGFSNRAYYNKNGHWQYSLIYKTEDKLPKDVRATVKSVYYDWTITVVEEIRTNEGMNYLVYLEDNSNLRILKVSPESEMETMMELAKQ